MHGILHHRRSPDRHAPDLHAVARMVVGGIWLAGAAFNALVTRTMDDPYIWLADESRLGVVRWFFGDIVSANPAVWTVALALGEALLGVLTLGRGRRAALGLLGGALFSAGLFALATPYTLVMGPYALLLGWMARSHLRSMESDQARRGASRRRQQELGIPAGWSDSHWSS